MCASWVASGKSFPVAGVTRRDGMAFQTTKKIFPGLFCCCCYFGFCLFVCFKTLLMHTTTWHQYPALPGTNEMTTGPIMVLDGNKRNSLLVCCWFSLYSGPLLPNFILIWKMSPISGGPLVGVSWKSRAFKNVCLLFCYCCCFLKVVGWF